MGSVPAVSVLMTAYNREKYIATAIKSVLASTFENWELIILDDCSKDNTFKIAKEYEALDSRIKAYQNPVNLGQFKNRNTIVDFASGEYLKFLDSDDLLYPFGLEQLVFYMNKFARAGYGLCSIEQDRDEIFPFELSATEAYHRHYIDQKKTFYKAPLSSIIRKKAFESCGGFPHEAVSGDFAMWNVLSAKFPVVLMPHGIVWYREHAEQEMQKTRDNSLVEFEYLKVAEYFIKHEDCPLKRNQQQKVLKRIKSDQLKYIFWKTRTLGIATGMKLLNFNKKPFSLTSAY